jgi:hypothetical protein
MTQQTSVEWLFSQIPFEWSSSKSAFEALQQAKEMDKQQKIDAYSHGWHDGQDVIISQVKHIDKGGDDAGEEYYNETFNKTQTQ